MFLGAGLGTSAFFSLRGRPSPVAVRAVSVSDALASSSRTGTTAVNPLEPNAQPTAGGRRSH